MKSLTREEVWNIWRSLPVRGAWVEMETFGHSSKKENVAPRAGSVG